MTRNKNYLPSKIGSVQIANDVIAIIAGLAATEVEGVIGMSKSTTGGIAGVLGLNSVTEGVKVKVTDNEVFIQLFIVIKHGFKIPDVTKSVHEKVRETVEVMTGLVINKIDIHIVGVELTPKAK